MSLLKYLFRHQTIHRRREGDFRSDRDWRLLFGSFLVLAIASFIAAVYLYRILDNLEVVSQRRLVTESSTRLDQKTLEQVVKVLAEKQVRFEAYLAGPTTIVDPAR